MKTCVLFSLAAALCAPALATHYYWVGGASGNWADGNNWSLTEGGEPANAYPATSDDDATIATDGATVSLPSALLDVNAVHVNANVTLNSGGANFSPITLDGTGVLTLGDGVKLYTDVAATVSVDLKVDGAVSVTAKDSCWTGFKFDEKCGLSGAGTVSFSGNKSGHTLSWSAAEFIGTIVVENGSGRNLTSVSRPEATNCGMTWTVANSSYGREKTYFISSSSDRPYVFGSLSGSVYFAQGDNMTPSAFVKDILMEIGALGNDDTLTGRVARDDARANEGPSIRKVGLGTLSTSIKCVKAYYLKSGTLNILSDDVLSESNESIYGTQIVFEGGVLKVADVVTKDVSLWFGTGSAENPMSSPVIFDDEGRDHTWAATLPATLTGGLEKRGAGTLTLTATPAYSGATTVKEGALLLPANSTIETLVVEGDGKIGVLPSSATTTEQTFTISAYSLPEGKSIQDVFVSSDLMTTDFAEEAGAVTVTVTRGPQTYVWTGASDSAWETLGNWTVNGIVPDALPVAQDTIQFLAQENATNEVVLADGVVVSKVIVDGTTKISGGIIQSTNVCSTAGLESAELLILGDDAGLGTWDAYDSKLVIDVNLEIAASATSTNVIESYKKGNSVGSDIWLNGNLTGTGTIQFSGPRLNCRVNGDNRAFAGTVYVKEDGDGRNNTHLTRSEAGSALARWHIYNSEDGNFVNSTTLNVEFGELTHFRRKHHGGAEGQGMLTIGGLNTDFSCTGEFGTGWDGKIYRNHKIEKVGTGTMTFSGTHVLSYTISNGTLVLASDASVTEGGGYTFNGGALKLDPAFTIDPSTNFVATTAAIIVDDGGVDRTFEIALPATTGGFVKKGAGALTLAAAPLYTGATRIEDGSLHVAGTFDAAQTTIVVDDPVAAEAAGTVYLSADSVAGRLTLESTHEKASKYRFAKTVENGRTVVKVAKLGGFSLIVR